MSKVKSTSIQLKDNSQPITHEFENTYTKGGFYCVYNKDEDVTYKYPQDDIWRVKEDYGTHQTK